jgi:ERF superfamily
MIETSTDMNELAPALAKAQAAMEGAKKDSANPFFKSKYADLASVWDAARIPLTNNGLSVVQTASTTNDDTGVTVHISTMLLHASGQFIRDTISVKPKENSPQGVGSAITYLRRYALAAIAGVAPEDDDGNAASGRASQAQVGPRSGVEDVKARFQQATPAKIVTPAQAQ